MKIDVAKLTGFGAAARASLERSQALNGELDRITRMLETHRDTPKVPRLTLPDLAPTATPMREIKPLPSQTALVRRELIQLNESTAMLNEAILTLVEIERDRDAQEGRRDKAQRRRDWVGVTLITVAIAIAALTWVFPRGSSTPAPTSQHPPALSPAR